MMEDRNGNSGGWAELLIGAVVEEGDNDNEG
jgi:hypothetical protein